MECIVRGHGKISSENGISRSTYQTMLCNSWLPKRRNVLEKGKTLSSVTEDLKLHIKGFKISRVENLGQWHFSPILVSLQGISS